MLIKSVDDKAKRLAFLKELQRSSLLDRRQQEWLRDEHHRTQRGMAGERDAAHYLDNYLKDDADRVLLHDLRFQVDGDVIQIDHMVITRSLYVYLLETKNFNGNLRINEFGEFSVEYPGERLHGIPSPLEQSRRHEGPLKKLFTTLGIEGRNGGVAQFHHCVLLRPSSLIHRPPASKLDTSNVIKADQFRAWHEKFKDQNSGVGAIVGSILNIRSSDTIRDFAHKLVRQHRPADLLTLPAFMASPSAGQDGAATASKSVPAALHRAGRDDTSKPATDRRRLICATCGSKIAFSEGKFCWNNERRFGGLQYCRAHQAAVR
ncbi:MAG TPA: nuclease-related domain-containing protein [Rubrivivax sp.]|nr:nuclease-related domain-containing protein [Rubrivivax sp.]